MENSKKEKNLSRRGFMGVGLSAAAIFNIVPRHVLGGPNFVAPSEKVNIALIGAGGQGRSNARHLFNEPEAQIIAVADPMESVTLEKFYYKGLGGRKPVKDEIEKHYAAKTPNYQCAEYEDFRIMLEKEKAIDAILCATPDHLHAYVSVTAMRQGKHVYCEKPLAHNIRETRLVARVAKETGVATQMGNQGHSKEGIRQTVEYLRDGAIGEVRETHSWVPAGRWNPGLTGYPPDEQPLPGGFNWDLWLGPREYRPFNLAYVPVAWRDFWTYGCGALGDFGCHDLDSVVWAYDLQAPETVEAYAAGFMNEVIAPYGETCVYKFPAKGKQPPLTVNWYSGGLQPPRPAALPEGINLPRRGVLFVGEKGIIQCDGAGGEVRLFPHELRKSYQKPENSIPRSKGHHKDWIDAIKGGAPASSEFQYASRLTEITLLGIVALQAKQQCRWDSENMKLAGCENADAFINGTYRKGWEVI